MITRATALDRNAAWQSNSTVLRVVKAVAGMQTPKKRPVAAISTSSADVASGEMKASTDN